MKDMGVEHVPAAHSAVPWAKVAGTKMRERTDKEWKCAVGLQLEGPGMKWPR